MKLPTFSLNFFKKPTKKKRIITTFGKRDSSASSSTRKSRRSSSGRKSRKRSITYYAPSKSKFYPTEHFPSLQRAARQVTTVATTPLAPLPPRSYPLEVKPVASIESDAKLNNGFPSATGTHRSYTAKQTYLCDNDYGDIVLHQPPAWYMQSKARQNSYQIDQTTVTNNGLRGSNTEYTPNKLFSNAPIDSNGNLLYDDNCLNNAYTSSMYPKECAQGVPIQSMVNAIPFDDSNIKYNSTELRRQSQHNLLPSSVTTAYNNTVFSSVNSTNAKCLPNNINNNKFSVAYQTNANQFTPNAVHGLSLPIYSGMVPFKKKSDRHRRRKVRSYVICCLGEKCEFDLIFGTLHCKLIDNLMSSTYLLLFGPYQYWCRLFDLSITSYRLVRKQCSYFNQLRNPIVWVTQRKQISLEVKSHCKAMNALWCVRNVRRMLKLVFLSLSMWLLIFIYCAVASCFCGYPFIQFRLHRFF